VIYGILLAAGLGQRIGMPKALLTLGGLTFHERGRRAFAAAGLEVVVVANPVVAEALPAPQAREHRVINLQPDEGGMFGSVRQGLAHALVLGATGAILLPVDHPLVASDDIRLLQSELAAGAAMVIAEHGGRRGHPIGLSLALMREATSDPSLSTLRDLRSRHASKAVVAAVSEGALQGVNSKEDLERVSNGTFR